MKRKSLGLFPLLSLALITLLSQTTPVLASPDGNYPGEAQINWLIRQQNLHNSGLVQSYEDGNNLNAYIFDQALAIVAFTASGEVEKAKEILNVMKGLQLTDVNNVWVECYDVNDPNKATNCDKRVTGPIAWMVIAINFYECKTKDSNYAPMARMAFEWLDALRITEENDERRGSLKYSDVDPNISTEHNIDAYSAYYWRGMLDANDSDVNKASLIMDYLRREMWAPSPNSNEPCDLSGAVVFWEGFGPKGYAFSTDPQSWGVLALGAFGPDGEEFYKSLDWLWYSPWGNTRTVQDFNDRIEDVNGFKSGTGEPNDYVWVDGTEHAVAAYYSVSREGYKEKGDLFHTDMRRIIDINNGGLVHSFCQTDPNTIRWPENFRYNYVASAAWYYFNEARINPFNLRPCFAECRAANIDKAGKVAFIDYAIFALDWLETGSDPYLAGDINRDGRVNRIDLDILTEYWLKDCNE